MGHTNNILTIAKLLEEPQQKKSEKSFSGSIARVCLPQVRASETGKLIVLIFPENLSQIVLDYYKANDYLLVEGSISVKLIHNGKFTLKSTEITVSKVYPLFLASK